MLKLIFSALLLCAGASALAIEKITLWPTVLFVRGQDLCQYQDAYGQSRNDLTAQATNQLKALVQVGVDSKDAIEILLTVDALIDKKSHGQRRTRHGRDLGGQPESLHRRGVARPQP